MFRMRGYNELGKKTDSAVLHRMSLSRKKSSLKTMAPNVFYHTQLWVKTLKKLYKNTGTF